MNKRQITKRGKVIRERAQFFSKYLTINGRKNGKYILCKIIYKACLSKRYAPFKKIRKIYNKIFISLDLSNGNDYGVVTTAKISKGIVSIISSKIFE